MVPEGWSVTRLIELADVKRGAGSQYLTYVDSPEDGVRLIRISDFLGDSKKYIKYTSAIDRFILEKEDILIAGTGATAGIIFRVPDEYAGLPFSYNAPRIRPKTTSCSGYLYYYLCSDHVIRQQHALFTGNAQPFLDTKAIGGFKVFAPPLPEQKKIAQILSTWDQAITATERLLENSQQRKKGLMQQLLTGKKRLPGFEGEWDRKPLGAIARVYQPKTISQSSLKEHGYPVYGANGLIGFYDHYNHEYEQIAVTCRGSTCGLVNWTRSKSWITGNAMVINVDDNPEVDKRYLYYVLAGSSLDYLVTGSGQPQITGDIKRHEVLLPSINEQSTISKIIHKADQDIEQLQKYVACLKQEKQALMQQLLTGKRRVQVDTEAA